MIEVVTLSGTLVRVIFKYIRYARRRLSVGCGDRVQAESDLEVFRNFALDSPGIVEVDQALHACEIVAAEVQVQLVVICRVVLVRLLRDPVDGRDRLVDAIIIGVDLKIGLRARDVVVVVNGEDANSCYTVHRETENVATWVVARNVTKVGVQLDNFGDRGAIRVSGSHRELSRLVLHLRGSKCEVEVNDSCRVIETCIVAEVSVVSCHRDREGSSANS